MEEKIKDDEANVGVVVVGENYPSLYEHKVLEWLEDHDWVVLRSSWRWLGKMQSVIQKFKSVGVLEKERHEFMLVDNEKNTKVPIMEVRIEKIPALKGIIKERI